MEEGALRFTKKGNTLYAVALEKPSDKLVIQTLGKDAQAETIPSISTLGSKDEVQWKQSPEQLVIQRSWSAGWQLRLGI